MVGVQPSGWIWQAVCGDANRLKPELQRWLRLTIVWFIMAALPGSVACLPLFLFFALRVIESR